MIFLMNKGFLKKGLKFEVIFPKMSKALI